MASKVVSMRFREEQFKRLERMARRLGRKPSEVGAMLVEEGLRRSEFPLVEFRDTAAGRQAYIQGSRVQVWMLVMIARNYEMDPEKTAEHLEWPVYKVNAGFAYAEAFPEEIEAWIEDNRTYARRMLPQLQALSASNEPTLRGESTR